MIEKVGERLSNLGSKWGDNQKNTPERVRVKIYVMGVVDYLCRKIASFNKY